MPQDDAQTEQSQASKQGREGMRHTENLVAAAKPLLTPAEQTKDETLVSSFL